MTALNDLRAKLVEADETEAPMTLTHAQIKLLIERGDVLERLAAAAITDAPALMNVKEVCRELRVCRNTLWAMRRSGRFIEPFSVNKARVLFRRTDFLNWLSKAS
jgi:hypothetical protein